MDTYGVDGISASLTRIVDPFAGTVTIADHLRKVFYRMVIDQKQKEDRCWMSVVTSAPVPADRIESCTSQKTIEGVVCCLLVVDPRLSYEAWISHELGFAVREQIRMDDWARHWALRDIRLGEVDDEAFQICQEYIEQE